MTIWKSGNYKLDKEEEGMYTLVNTKGGSCDLIKAPTDEDAIAEAKELIKLYRQ